mmetsp:Transcript_32364/g.29182  ORF Transcript_32364/g.29182 Transcript_32364/m.29182 type:complete len:179 (-) Transcript_32364:307-843(-)
MTKQSNETQTHLDLCISVCSLFKCSDSTFDLDKLFRFLQKLINKCIFIINLLILVIKDAFNHILHDLFPIKSHTLFFMVRKQLLSQFILVQYINSLQVIQYNLPLNKGKAQVITQVTSPLIVALLYVSLALIGTIHLEQGSSIDYDVVILIPNVFKFCSVGEFGLVKGENLDFFDIVT